MIRDAFETIIELMEAQQVLHLGWADKEEEGVREGNWWSFVTCVHLQT